MYPYRKKILQSWKISDNISNLTYETKTTHKYTKYCNYLLFANHGTKIVVIDKLNL